MAKPHEINRRWYVIDAAGRPLGRVATEAARLLRGKHKPEFTPQSLANQNNNSLQPTQENSISPAQEVPYMPSSTDPSPVDIQTGQGFEAVNWQQIQNA